LSWAKEHPNQLSERVLRPRNANDRQGETHRPSAFAPGPDQHLRTMGLTRYFAGETSLEEIERVLPRGSFGTDTFTTDSPFS